MHDQLVVVRLQEQVRQLQEELHSEQKKKSVAVSECDFWKEECAKQKRASYLEREMRHDDARTIENRKKYQLAKKLVAGRA